MRLALLLTVLACQSGSQPGGVEPDNGHQEPDNGHQNITGFEGTAYMGPIRPVCRVESPCEAPFTAGFEVWRSDRVVARFQSDSAGRFRLQLPPGTYTVIPDSSAGILLRGQAQQVTVEASRLTQVEWHFDTGIQ